MGTKLRDLQNFYAGTITTAFDAGDLKIYVDTLPTPSEGWVVINSGNTQKREIVYYTATGNDGGGNFLTLSTRGIGGTTDQSHDINEPVRMNLTAEHWSEADGVLAQMQTDIDNIVAAGAPDAAVGTKGIAKLSVAPVSATNPIACGDNDPRLVAAPPQNIAIPSAQYYLNFSTDTLSTLAGTSTTIYLHQPNTFPQEYNMTADWADVNISYSSVLLGDYLYVLMLNSTPDPDQWRIYRYDRTNLAAGGTLITFSGQAIADANVTLYMATDGTDIYINYDGGNSANDYEVSKYTISGTVFTYDSTITCGSTALDVQRMLVNSNGIYGLKMSGNNIAKITKFNFSGVEQSNSGAIIATVAAGLMTYGDTFYTLKNSIDEDYSILYVE